METYTKVRDVLEKAREFHQQLTEFYDRLSDRAERDRVEMLLDYMSRHEEGFEEAFDDYTDEGAEKLLETWMQYGPEEDTLDVPDPGELDADMDVDDVVATALDLDDALVRFYEEVAERAKSSDVRDLFRKLREQQESEKAKLKRAAHQIRHGQ